MDTERILQELDRLFATYQIDKVEAFLENRINEAVLLGDDGAEITLLNEMIGYLRDAGKYEKCVSYCERLAAKLESSDLRGTVPYATSLVNIANAYRAAGKLDESLVLFKSAQMIFEQKLPADDMLFASLYNNMALLYQEAKDFEASCACLQKALDIVSKRADQRIETATTHTNLAMSLLKLGDWETAMEHLRPAFSIFEMDDETDYHYSGALSAMGEALYLAGRYDESAAYYERALAEIEKHMGRTAAYEIVAQNLEAARYKAKEVPDVAPDVTSGLALCEAFYKEYGEPMLREKFAPYFEQMACGLVGEGSECLGYDDMTSRDHDFGPGFCIWLTDSVYDEIGERLQEEYDKLPRAYMGIVRRESPKAPKRVGVFRISDFYNRLIGLPDAPESQHQWLFLDDYRLLNASNGKVFHDPVGEFTRIRTKIRSYYPEEVRIRKVAREAALIAQSGQYNYGRMFGRGDLVTSGIALSEFMKHTMLMVHLLNRRYAPYYKWLRRSLEDLPLLTGVRDILDAMAGMQVGDPRIPECIEMIVKLIIAEMQKQRLTAETDTYLDHHTDSILRAIAQKDEDPSVHSEFVEELIRLEWETFDKTKNIGGRADCQDDHDTFYIMRKSQYLTWSSEMLKSYIQDFRRAIKEGRNLISEKYGYMMESTSPAEYAAIRHLLPEVPEEKLAIINAICEVQVGMMEECAEKYPLAASQARAIHTAEDTPFSTSYETYLRGELKTYSDETLDLYGRFVVELAKRGVNLAQMIIENTAILYGYDSLDDLEAKLR